MLDAADILVDRQPVIGRFRIRRVVLPGRREAGEVPGGIDEGIHRVGFPARVLAALGQAT